MYHWDGLNSIRAACVCAYCFPQCNFECVVMHLHILNTCFSQRCFACVFVYSSMQIWAWAGAINLSSNLILAVNCCHSSVFSVASHVLLRGMVFSKCYSVNCMMGFYSQCKPKQGYTLLNPLTSMNLSLGLWCVTPPSHSHIPQMSEIGKGPFKSILNKLIVRSICPMHQLWHVQDSTKSAVWLSNTSTSFVKYLEQWCQT